MNILITGGTGLIGKQLVNQLLTRNHHITVLTRNTDKAAKLLPSKVKLINKLSLEDIENVDTVINLAGEPIADKRWSIKQKNTICDSRWSITKQLTDFIQQAKNPPELFISGSAIGIYGRQADTPIDESFADHHREFTNDVCVKWEHLARQAESEKTRVAMLRTGIVLDNKAGALAKMLMPFRCGLGGKISHGNQMMSWVHIDDMVSAILFILENNMLNGPINITSENPVTNEEFSKTLAKMLNRPCLFSTPALVFRLMFGEMADILLYGQCVLPSKLTNSGFVFKYPELTTALHHLLNEK